MPICSLFAALGPSFPYTESSSKALKPLNVGEAVIIQTPIAGSYGKSEM